MMMLHMEDHMSTFDGMESIDSNVLEKVMTSLKKLLEEFLDDSMYPCIIYYCLLFLLFLW